MSTPAADTLLFAAYVLVFVVTAGVCVASLPRTKRIVDPDVRRGLAGLLATSGGWAAAQAGYLVAPTRAIASASYTVGLVVGFATVGAWLYFCSAYAGRTYHRMRPIRRFALGVFLVLVLLKATNPLHGSYFVATPAAVPFPHLAIGHGLLHWITMGLSYVLAAIGYFLLFERFVQVDAETRPLAFLVGLTALPVLFTVLGLASPTVLDVPYEPIGVAAFAVGVLFVYQDRFQAVQVASDVDDPVVFLDRDGRIREVNRAARELVPELSGTVGDTLSSAAPSIAEALAVDDPVVELETGDESRYYRVSRTPFAAGEARLGELLAFDDVTAEERYRRELERQTERLERFASVVAHDLRNPLTVAQGHVDLAREAFDSEHLETAADAHDRMEALIDDLLALARQGNDVDEPEPVSLEVVARESWRGVDTADATLDVRDSATILADGSRLRQLLENLYRNATEHAGADVTVAVGTLADGFYVEDDGPGFPDGAIDDVFDPGFTTAEEGTGFGLAIVTEIADAHGWTVAATSGSDGGARFEFTGVEFSDN